MEPVDPDNGGNDITSLVLNAVTVSKTDKAKLKQAAAPVEKTAAPIARTAAKPAALEAEPAAPVAKPDLPVAKPAAVPVEQPDEDEEELRIPPDDRRHVSHSRFDQAFVAMTSTKGRFASGKLSDRSSAAGTQR